MDIQPIHNEQDYERALARIDQLMDAGADTPEADELEILATLVEVWEERVFPVAAPDPVMAIHFRMEQQGLTRKDLEPCIGPSGRVAEVLNGKRGLSLRMIRQLHQKLEIPLESLIQPAESA